MTLYQQSLCTLYLLAHQVRVNYQRWFRSLLWCLHDILRVLTECLLILLMWKAKWNVYDPTIKVCPIHQSIHHSLTSWHRAGADRRHGRYRGRWPECRLTLNSGVSDEVRATERWSLHVAGTGWGSAAHGQAGGHPRVQASASHTDRHGPTAQRIRTRPVGCCFSTVCCVQSGIQDREIFVCFIGRFSFSCIGYCLFCFFSSLLLNFQKFPRNPRRVNKRQTCQHTQAHANSLSLS